MRKEGTKADRRHQRVATPKGVWVAWQNEKHQNVSRVRDLNVGGMFIATPTPLPVGTVLPVLLSVPEGEIRATDNSAECHRRPKAWACNSPKSLPKTRRAWTGSSRAC